ncbi:MAG: hypothetical protein ACNS63_01975 [Candidatus Nitrospinota bacterium M3_3B_026]
MIDWIYLLLAATLGAGFYLGKIFYRPDRETLEKMAATDEREKRLSGMRSRIRNDEAYLRTREAQVKYIREEAGKVEKNARAEVAKYKNIAAKARRELAGARARFKRKLKRIEDNQGARGV